ncbi:DUF3973 domain-containing protein [Paenibacillus aceris]|uniref:DUF3973 domain-containing protein n=1 Tax=Paenibacillus aceris TaxID=869555 RepID=A0ABS4HWV5_9BACL|nr:hypothetical protein [Paenibacillus aceris]NHW38727.1 DUF3973 domain-containing protein [Paenibacillus aceris]
MNSYFCAQCKMLHVKSLSPYETIFTSGFHWVDSTLYQVGVCNKQFIMPIEDTTTNNSHLLILG